MENKNKNTPCCKHGSHLCLLSFGYKDLLWKEWSTCFERKRPLGLRFLLRRERRRSVKRNMYLIYTEYLAILIFILISIVLSCILFGLSYAFIGRSPDMEKLSAYECGFNPFEDSRNKFDIRFYIVAILFIVFDLEVTFLCPWSVVLRKIDALGFWGMMLFLWILTVGFIFEWRKGALDWS